MKLLLLAVMSIFWSGSATAGLPSPQTQLRDHLKVEKYQLENGLTVILHEDRSVPMVSYHQWFYVGSSHEKPGRTGLAHFFEHLMFKGSKNFSSEAYEAFIAGNGGYNNAFTSRDYTGYFTLIPSDKLKTIIDIEADRLVNLVFDDKEIQSEREVVKEERRYRYDNSPDGKLYHLTNETVFQKGPYSWPVIGSMKDLNAATLEEFREFYKTYYAPNNAVVVVTGAFDPKKVKRWIQSAYGSIAKQNIPAPNFAKEPAQTRTRRTTARMDVQAPKLSVAFRTVDTFNDDSYALSSLASLLGGGASSRLYKKLVREKQLVSTLSVDQSSGKLDGSFSLTMDLRPQVSIQRVLREIDEEVKNLQNQKVDEPELNKVKNEVLLGYTRALNSMAGKARVLAYSQITYGDPTQFFEDLDKYAAVTAEDIQRVTKQYLTDSRKSIVTILPK